MHPTVYLFFYQKYCGGGGDSVHNIVLSVLNNSHDPTPLNHTHLALIPKVKNPMSPTGFRPISLCNVSLRLITKTIAYRLKSHLPAVIDPCQSAFVPGRLITGNALLAFEVFYFTNHNKVVTRGSYAFKLDMSNVYDRVEWEFLRGFW